MSTAEQLSQLRRAAAAVGGVLRTPRRQEPYLEVELGSLEGVLYWRPDKLSYEFRSARGSDMIRTPEKLLTFGEVEGKGRQPRQ